MPPCSDVLFLPSSGVVLSPLLPGIALLPLLFGSVYPCLPSYTAASCVLFVLWCPVSSLVLFCYFCFVVFRPTVDVLPSPLGVVNSPTTCCCTGVSTLALYCLLHYLPHVASFVLWCYVVIFAPWVNDNLCPLVHQFLSNSASAS